MKRVKCSYCNTSISETHKFCKECGRANIFYKGPVKEKEDVLKSLELISSIVENTEEKFIKKYKIYCYTHDILVKNNLLRVASPIYENITGSLMLFIDLANQLKDIEGVSITKNIAPDGSLEIAIMLDMDIKDEHFYIFYTFIGATVEYRICSKLNNEFNKYFKYIYQQLLSMEDLFKITTDSNIFGKTVADTLVEIINKQYQTAESGYKVLLKAKRTVDKVLKESE